MKSNNPSSFYFSALKPVKQDDSAKLPEQSPYLKAVLSSKRTPGSAKVISLSGSSLAAALRYISNNK